MTPSQINCFFAVVERGSFSEAAKSLFIAQPAVSKQIRMLEEELQLRLFERKGHTIALTAEGNLIYITLKDCKLAFENALSDARNFKKDATVSKKNIQFGCPLFWNTDNAYRPIEAWCQERFPRLELSLMAYSQQDILEHVSNGTLDIAIHTEDAEPQPGLITEPYSMVNALLMYSAKSPLAKSLRCLQEDDNYILNASFDLQNPLYHEMLEALSAYLGVRNLKTSFMPDISQVYAYLEDPHNMFLASELFLWKSDPLLRYTVLPIPRKLFITRRKAEHDPEILFLTNQLIREFDQSSQD